ncbi:tRNA glutamyl-Q(34) synthetase GluQRS [Inhella proteolytica]|uniref:Glutamyl-Q tRNA(Asp) synthetase n=1 Tax=Inhella proteolytica TaxID=2795029 RepID=A0A931J5L5_9BURK|nr:tRNA glutamyl-Q(34) synthetase GluQRS [Inhella proteolytica]MBH9578620.1 tRNA glutamyl-Q(34) synthetase GluQRS [Inhella proteolytica]
MAYVGRFAPSPTGPLHAGSVLAALGSWLDARAHQGRWQVRIEDVDRPRCPPGTDKLILAQLDALGLRPDAPPSWQSQREALYEQALQRLIAAGLAYPCACTRKELAAAQSQRERHGELVYPGTCRPENGGLRGRPARAWRFRVPAGVVHWQDRRLGPQQQDVAQAVGDFVLKRADGLWAYQLAVVVDDAEQGISDVVRGEDLADNTPRQILLQKALGLPTPRHLHLPLVLAADGQKLSKQNGAAAFDSSEPLQALQAAAAGLSLQGLPPSATLPDWLHAATRAWAATIAPF